MQVQCSKCSRPIALTDIIESSNGARGDVPLALLVGEPVAELELHWKGTGRRGLRLVRCWRRLSFRAHLVFGARGSMVSGRQKYL